MVVMMTLTTKDKLKNKEVLRAYQGLPESVHCQPNEQHPTDLHNTENASLQQQSIGAVQHIMNKPEVAQRKTLPESPTLDKPGVYTQTAFDNNNDNRNNRE